MNETIEIIKEARKAGMQTACLLFACLCIVAGLFAFYIYKSYEPQTITSRITQTQDGTNNNQEMINGETKSNS